MNKKRSNIKSHGFSLVEVMIALGISSAVVLGWTATLSTGLRGQKSIQVNVDRIAITKFLMQKVDCGKSFDNTTCPTSGAGGPKKLLDKKGLTVVSDAGAGTKFGGLTIKSECNAANDGLTIKAATLSSTGQLTSTSPSDFLPNPLTGKTQTWEDAKALLLPETISLCPTFGGGFQSSEYILIEDREPWGTEGGKCAPTTTWRTVTLNYEVSDTKNSVVVNADSSFTLQKGVYECVLNPLLRWTDRSRARLIFETTTVNLTTGATVITPTVMAYSQSMRISIASPAVAINHKFTVDTPTKFKLQVWCLWDGQPGQNNALGVGTNTMDEATKVHETFAQVECRKYTQ